MDEYIKGFMDENDISFNEFFENYKLKILSKNKEYNDLKSKKRKIYDKYPEIMHLIEDSVPMTFDVEKVQDFNELQTICSMMDKIEVKEAYKLGAKESYICSIWICLKFNFEIYHFLEIIWYNVCK